MDSQRDYPGARTAAYFAARGVHLSPDEARELVRVFLRLADLRALAAAPLDEPPGSSPKTTARAVVSCADRGAGDGRGRTGAAGLQGPTVYNVGPSEYIGGQE